MMLLDRFRHGIEEKAKRSPVAGGPDTDIVNLYGLGSVPEANIRWLLLLAPTATRQQLRSIESL